MPVCYFLLFRGLSCGGQDSFTGLFWALLCSQWESWESWASLSHGLSSWSDNLRVLGIKGDVYKAFDSKAWKSHIITSTTHPFAQSKTEASAGSRGRERDSDSPWEKQEIIVTSFPPPLRAALLKLSYWTDSFSFTLTSLAESTVGFPPKAGIEEQKPQSLLQNIVFLLIYDIGNFLKVEEKSICFLTATWLFLLKYHLVWQEILYSLLYFHPVSKIFPFLSSSNLGFITVHSCFFFLTQKLRNSRSMFYS